MKTKLYLNLLIATCAAQLHASQMAHIHVPRTYQGTTITAHNIVALAPQSPTEIRDVTQQWLTDNPHIAGIALGYESFIPQDVTIFDPETNSGKTVKTIKPLLDATNAMLKQQETPNMSQWNYVFQHQKTKDWLVKIGGHVNRKYNISHLAQALKHEDLSPWGKSDYNYNYQLSQADYDRFARELPTDAFDKVIQKDGQETHIFTAPKTYQHISRIAHYLLLLDAKERHNLSIEAPDMHLVHIPGRPQEVSDRNYIVIERKHDDLKEIEHLTSKEKQEMDLVARETGIFNFNRENCKRTSKGNLIILDFEQPNNSLPSHFFHQSETRFVNNMQAGLNSIDEMKKQLKPTPEDQKSNS